MYQSTHSIVTKISHSVIRFQEDQTKVYLETPASDSLMEAMQNVLNDTVSECLSAESTAAVTVKALAYYTDPFFRFHL